MKNSGPSLTKPSKAIPSWFIPLFLLVSFFGFLDATYLAAMHYLGLSVPCSIVEGCERVTTSQYAKIGGIPVALLGAFYYLSIFLAGVAFWDSKKEKILFWAARFTAVGFFASLWFIFLQLFIIKALCLYCMGSATTSTLLFLLSLFIIRQSAQKRKMA